MLIIKLIFQVANINVYFTTAKKKIMFFLFILKKAFKAPIANRRWRDTVQQRRGVLHTPRIAYAPQTKKIVFHTISGRSG